MTFYMKNFRLHITSLIHTSKLILKSLFAKKEYYQSIQLCSNHGIYVAVLITKRIPIELWANKKIASFTPYVSPKVFRVNRCKYKIFFTQENTRVKESQWEVWNDCYLWENAPSLSMGFDYYDHPKYIRFPYWLAHMFPIEVTHRQIESFVLEHTISNSSNRINACAFICRKDYFGDRTILADMVSTIMPMHYPSDFRHNDDDMWNKFNNDKIAYLRQFKFNLCPENSNNRGYVTEKIFEAIKAGCVPIYWGNEGYPEPDILNPKAIVYIDKDHPNEGLALLRNLYEDPKAYEEFVSQPRFLPGAADKIYSYFERLEKKIMEVLK